MEEGLEENNEIKTSMQSESDQNLTNTPIKTHKEITEMINDLKDFEKDFGEFEIIEINKVEDLIEVDIAERDIIQSKFEKKDLEHPKKKLNKFNIKIRKKSDDLSISKSKKTATFKIRFDESGNLINMDIRKPPPKKQLNIKNKIIGKLPKLKKTSLRKKGKKSKDDGELKDNKLPKKGFKGKLGKIGNLKKAIPGKGKSKKNKKSKDEE